MAMVPIFGLSGQCAGPSELKFACASVHALCPSAASGLTVKPGGRVTTDACKADGVAANPSG